MVDAGELRDPLVIPQLRYGDPEAAVDWLCRVFGFEESSRMTGPDATLHLADLRTPGGGRILVCGAWAVARQMRARFPDDYRPETDAAWPNPDYSITVMIPDVDAHFDQACEEGARIVAEPTDQPWGLRDYEAIDLGGRVWNFSQPLPEPRSQT
jgi:uncharacterized glyoxalase superfamily protein PhnB